MTQPPDAYATKILNIVDLGDHAALIYWRHGPIDPLDLGNSIAEFYELPSTIDLTGVDTQRPSLLPGRLVQGTAYWLAAVARADLLDIHNLNQRRAARLIQYFRRERDRRADTVFDCDCVWCAIQRGGPEDR